MRKNDLLRSDFGEVLICGGKNMRDFRWAYRQAVTVLMGWQKYSGFIARFDYTGALSTTETQRAASDIVLFDNPNNGNFSLKGKALAQHATQLRIFDASGRMIHQQSLPKQETVTLTLQSQLKPGMYLLHLLEEKQEKLKTLKLMVRE